MDNFNILILIANNMFQRQVNKCFLIDQRERIMTLFLWKKALTLSLWSSVLGVRVVLSR